MTVTIIALGFVVSRWNYFAHDKIEEKKEGFINCSSGVRRSHQHIWRMPIILFLRCVIRGEHKVVSFNMFITSFTVKWVSRLYIFYLSITSHFFISSSSTPASSRRTVEVYLLPSSFRLIAYMDVEWGQHQQQEEEDEEILLPFSSHMFQVIKVVLPN